LSKINYIILVAFKYVMSTGKNRILYFQSAADQIRIITVKKFYEIHQKVL